MLKVFIKTFIVCVVILFGWTIWTMFEGDGFEDVEKVRTEVYSKSDTTPLHEPETDNEHTIVTTSIYFLNSKNEIVEVKRDIKNPSLEKTISELLKGTTKEEQQQGIYSEIPSDAKLIGISTYSNKIVINLNSKFIKGGGTTS